MPSPNTHRMKRGFYTIMAAQFFSSLADNALFIAAVELLKSMKDDDERQGAAVYMDGLSQMRSEWGARSGGGRSGGGRGGSGSAGRGR